jgi:hypothetical protein
LNASGVYAANIGGKLTLYADSSATNDGSTEGTGVIAINNINGTPLATLGITGGEYAAPAYFAGANYKHQDGVPLTRNQNLLVVCSNKPTVLTKAC